MSIATYGYGGRGGSVSTYGYGGRFAPFIEVVVAAIGMQFETDYERDYVVLAYYLKHELMKILLTDGKEAFQEVEIGDTENIEAMPSAYIFFAPTSIAENYVGAKTTTHFFTFTIKVRMGKANTPLNLFHDIARFHGLVYNAFISDRNMNNADRLTDVNNELEINITGPLCIHRTIGGWRPPIGGGPNDIFFDLLIEKRVR